ncbi:MAG: alpha-D-ribose 1-methylphosphonate 5-phosphate C-P-lyase PhnJ, partial [Chloroflexales bacterium]
SLYEQLVRFVRLMQGASYPVIVNRRYLMSPSPIPRWDTPALHQSAHLTILSAGREKRIYAVPPYTDVRPIEFSDVFFQVEDQTGRVCTLTGAGQKYMDELPQPGGESSFRISDTGYVEKLLTAARGEPSDIGPTYYDDMGRFFLPGVIRA